MENEDKKSSVLSVGKQIWLKYFKWIIVGIIGLILFLGYWIYTRGKKDTLAKIPANIPYPPESTTPQQDLEKRKWIDTVGSALVQELGEYLNTWHLTNFKLNSILVNKLKPLKDWQLVYINNGYNANYYTQGKGSLVKDLADVFYIGADGVRNDIVERLRKLGAK